MEVCGTKSQFLETLNLFKQKNIHYELYASNIELGLHKRNVTIRISDKFIFGIFIEFSVAKYQRGNNVEMVLPSDLNTILETLQKEISKYIEYELPNFNRWIIYRLDVCYNWIFQNLEEAELVMSFIQRIDYPRKKKSTYDTSVMYVGSAFTIKFYLKGAEFKKNDFKVISEVNSLRALELQYWANKIVRYEIGFKKKYLEELFGYKNLSVEHLLDIYKIEEILSYYLKDRVLKYVSVKNTTEAQVEEIIFNNFTKIKATRLLQFYRDFFLEDGAIKNRMLAGGLNRSTIYRYKIDLKKIGVGFNLPNNVGSSLLEQLTVPS